MNTLTAGDVTKRPGSNVTPGGPADNGLTSSTHQDVVFALLLAHDPARSADHLALCADELAAVIDTMIREQSWPHPVYQALDVIGRALGEMHVEADMLAEAWRVHARTHTAFVPLIGGAA